MRMRVKKGYSDEGTEEKRNPHDSRVTGNKNNCPSWYHGRSIPCRGNAAKDSKPPCSLDCYEYRSGPWNIKRQIPLQKQCGRCRREQKHIERPHRARIYAGPMGARRGRPYSTATQRNSTPPVCTAAPPQNLIPDATNGK